MEIGYILYLSDCVFSIIFRKTITEVFPGNLNVQDICLLIHLGTGESLGEMCRRASYVCSTGFLFFSRGTLILESYAVLYNDRIYYDVLVGFPS